MPVVKVSSQTGFFETFISTPFSASIILEINQLRDYSVFGKRSSLNVDIKNVKKNSEKISLF